MPVGTPFNQQFRAGDVIYGVSLARVPYINSLPPTTAPFLRANGQYVICDEFNNRTFGSVPVQDFGVGRLPDSTANIQANLGLHDNAAYLSALQKAALREYYEALAGTKYAPLQAVRVSLARTQAKGNVSREDLVFRRACKFGLHYIIEKQKRTVHFVLDLPPAWGMPGNRINSLDVVLKSPHAGHVPITTSELRACYRNRNNWIPSGRLKFYFNLLEVNPPWVDDAAAWRLYEAYRIQKHGAAQAKPLFL